MHDVQLLLRLKLQFAAARARASLVCILACCCRRSAFHNTTAIVGAGVLGLPFAMKYLMWPGGVVVMCLSWITSLYTLWQARAADVIRQH